MNVFHLRHTWWSTDGLSTEILTETAVEYKRLTVGLYIPEVHHPSFIVGGGGAHRQVKTTLMTSPDIAVFLTKAELICCI